jgi:hypothetical protein
VIDPDAVCRGIIERGAASVRIEFTVEAARHVDGRAEVLLVERGGSGLVLAYSLPLGAARDDECAADFSGRLLDQAVEAVRVDLVRVMLDLAHVQAQARECPECSQQRASQGLN